MRVAVVERHRSAHAVLIGLRAPTSARMADVSPEVAAGLWVETVRVDDAKISVMRRYGALRTGWSEGLE